MTSLDAIKSALQLLGAIGPGQDPPGDEADDCFDALNRMIGRWATQPATQYVQARNVHALTADDQSYSIGSGGDFNQARPVNRDFLVSVIPDTTASIPVEIPLGRPLSIEDYQYVAQKTAEGSYPNRIYYDHNWSAGLGQITVFPVPTDDNVSLVLYTRTPLAVFADLSTDYTFPPGYEEAIVYNLALRLAPIYEKQPSPFVVQTARESLADIKRANLNPAEGRFPSALLGARGRYDIEADR